MDGLPHTTTPMTALRAATCEEHTAIEAAVDARRPFDDRGRYVTWLEDLLGIVETIDLELAHEGGLASAGVVRKAPWIVEDLRALGRSPAAIDALPRAPVRVDATRARAWGCAYVLEGSLLGGRVLARRVHESLALDSRSGARYLAGHGERTALAWRTFGTALDAWATRTRELPAIVEGARATFVRMRAWLERRT